MKKGDKSDLWTLTSDEYRKKDGELYFDVVCVCGHESTTRSCALGKKSGGCKPCRIKRHSMTGSSEYKVWSGMKRRASKNSKSAQTPKDAKNYKGRGIFVCDRWEVFEAFYQDMGPRPEGKTLERIDNSKGYSPDNCKWATMQEQQRNRRSNHRITLGGRTKVLAEWAEITGIQSATIRQRLNYGWSERRALTTPVRKATV